MAGNVQFRHTSGCTLPATPESTGSGVAVGGELRLAVIGTGALGSAVLEELLNAGQQSVLLVDPDRVEARNLALSPLLRAAMDGVAAASPTPAAALPNKAQLLAAYAQTARRLPWQAIPAEIADVGWAALRDIDLFCCCTDSALSRVETAYIARILGKPMIDGAVFGGGISAGRIAHFPADTEAACYLCGMSEDSRAAILGYAASAAVGCRLPVDVPSMTGTRKALRHVGAAVARALLEYDPADQPADSTATRERLTAGPTPGKQAAWQRESLLLPRSATCPWHETPLADPVPLPWEQPLRTSLESSGAQPARVLQLAWPVCSDAVCSACGTRSAPFERVGRVRRALPCGHCGQVQLQPVRAVHRIRAEDELSGLSPRQLGQPEHHLYWLRDTMAMTASVREDAS